MTSSALNRTSPLEPGFRLDRYELLCVLAQGGMATVWLARLQGKHGFEKLVAVKTILPAFAEEPQFQEMFLDEARIASGIEHPNCVQILDLGEHHGVLYLVMELVDGDPLQKLHRAVEKKGMRIPAGIALRIIADVCAGLDAAHRLVGPDGQPLHVVHRDVSPQNVLVTSNGLAKVIDFGIAKARDRVTGDTSTGTLKGKVQYMPREQALGDRVDGRADLWAVGAMTYALMAGRPPYQQESPLATLQVLLNQAPIAPLPASIPEPVRALVSRALEHDRELRFQTGAEMQAAVEEAMIESRLLTSSVQVGAFVKEHLGPRIESRKKAIERALIEAQNRSRSNKVLKSPLERPEQQTGSGVRGTHVGFGDTSASTYPPMPGNDVSSGPRSLHPGETFEGRITDAQGPTTVPPGGVVPRQRSFADLSGEVAAAENIDAPQFRPNRRTLVLALLGGIAAIIGVGLVLAFATPKENDGKPPKAVAPLDEMPHSNPADPKPGDSKPGGPKPAEPVAADPKPADTASADDAPKEPKDKGKKGQTPATAASATSVFVPKNQPPPPRPAVLQTQPRPQPVAQPPTPPTPVKPPKKDDYGF